MTVPPSRETHLVELVDAEGAMTGSTSVEEAHAAPGQLHRAFSVFLRDAEGRVLLQQRAATKTRFPLRWANTCCGHPAPGEDVRVAAARRLVEEVGVGGVALTEVGVYSYYAEDPVTGRVEYEYDHVLLGDMPVGRAIMPDPDEVAGVRWVGMAELRSALVDDPRSYAPWLSGVAERLADALPSSGSSSSASGAGSLTDGAFPSSGGLGTSLADSASSAGPASSPSGPASSSSASAASSGSASASSASASAGGTDDGPERSGDR
jgi:isopentenyl-diphosphate Delta-isomerase